MTDDELIQLAMRSREHAYAKYSGFAVGCTLFTTTGKYACGCNVENISYGLTICAERVALGSAIERGLTGFQTLALVAESKEPVVPCGACRQVLAEFAPDLRIISSNLKGVRTEFSLTHLLPKPAQGILG